MQLCTGGLGSITSLHIYVLRPSPISRFLSHKSLPPVTSIVSPPFLPTQTGHLRQRGRRKHNGETSKDQ